ncbi:hypothetical protein BDV3_001860 [Batrachochytrium dendrobatidis]|nr:hypothetical protein O5D80_007544 [Batrachochytrium dendrobatidis]KAK5666424.1 hypothetical protein QVD99_007180 [Batrachochytrium dendrobatidis]
MGICASKEETSSPTNLFTSSSQPTSNTAATREERLAAAEARQQANVNRGVQSTGGALSKKLQQQNSIAPGRIPINQNIHDDSNLQWRAD